MEVLIKHCPSMQIFFLQVPGDWNNTLTLDLHIFNGFSFPITGVKSTIRELQQGNLRKQRTI